MAVARVRPAAVGIAAAVAALLAVSARAAPPEEPKRRRVAVLELRGGVEGGTTLAEDLAARLEATAALAVVDLREARRRDPGVDGAVARCAGDLECTARVGRELLVDEVLLVAVSQLGDLVLNLQRVDVATARARGTPVSTVLAARGEIGRGELDAWLKQLYPPAVFLRYGSLVIEASVAGATVTLDDEEQGRTPLPGPIKLVAPSRHRVLVSKKGRVPYAADLDVLPDATVTLRAALPEAQAPTPWYKRWYTWAIAGGVVAAGLTTAIVVTATHVDDSRSGILVNFPPPAGN